MTWENMPNGPPELDGGVPAGPSRKLLANAMRNAHDVLEISVEALEPHA